MLKVALDGDGFSISEIKLRVEELLYYNPLCGDSVLEEQGRRGWYFLKEPTPRSRTRTWEEQQVLVGKGDEVPSAVDVVYAVLSHFFSTGERLFREVGVRTSSVDIYGHHIIVKWIGDVLCVCCGKDDRRYSSLGLAVIIYPRV